MPAHDRRFWLAWALVVSTVLGLACSTLTADLLRSRRSYCAENPSAEQCVKELPGSIVFYAVVGDWTRAKEAVLLAMPAMDLATAESVLMVVEEGDATLAETDRRRVHGEATTDDYERAAAALRRLSAWLRTVSEERAE